MKGKLQYGLLKVALDILMLTNTLTVSAKFDVISQMFLAMRDADAISPVKTPEMNANDLMADVVKKIQFEKIK